MSFKIHIPGCIHTIMTTPMPAGIITFIFPSTPGLSAAIMVHITPSSGHQDMPGMIPGLTGCYAILGRFIFLIRYIIPTRSTILNPTIVMSILKIIKKGNGTAGNQRVIAVLQLVVLLHQQKILEIQKIQEQMLSGDRK